MHLFFEDDGGFKAGTVLETLGAPEPTAFQVELPTGRRSKVKASHVLFKFAEPSPEDLLAQADAIARDIDVAFLHEVAPEDEFDAAALGAEYFGATPSPAQLAALLSCVHGAPMYFRRRGKGRYKPAPAAELTAALAGLERKRLAAEQQAALVEQLKQGVVPVEWRETPPGVPPRWLPRAAWLLFKPDKNSLEWKALDQAARESHTTPARLLLNAGAFVDARELHRAQFLVEWFPKGPHADIALPKAADAKLPLSDVRAFSIDDSETTEIDDAFSVRFIDENRVRVGVHIAAPGLSATPGDALDVLARKRMSTVYMPGEKITMLPDAIVNAYTLVEGGARPAVSLYADVDLASGECVASESRIERVPIEANLRHDVLDAVINEETLADTTTTFPFKAELQVLWRAAQFLSAQRERVRGKPEPRNRADFSFRVETIDGEERVRIEQRRRDAPLDRLVAEWMIFVNSAWGRRLDDAGVPCIYRTQTQWARPGSKQSSVRMTTVPAAHIGIGVTHYAWSSSPLRRYIDLVNQWQLLAVLRLQRPPFEKGSADLFAIIGAFDAAYAAYGDVQSRMERYWCLRWLAQEGAIGSGRRFTAMVLREERVRFAELPLVAPLAGIGHLAPGTKVEVDVLAVDDIDLTVECRLAVVHAEPVEAGESEDDTADGVGDESASVVDPERPAAPETEPLAEIPAPVDAASVHNATSTASGAR
ncbi:MAG TPA: RNB domain-containing ribonuclease [Burkholderiaceae bacterium]|nr:RNB domain-containing ribonuclease [Burkholderiaceae bacterium]